MLILIYDRPHGQRLEILLSLGSHLLISLHCVGGLLLLLNVSRTWLEWACLVVDRRQLHRVSKIRTIYPVVLLVNHLCFIKILFYLFVSGTNHTLGLKMLWRVVLGLLVVPMISLDQKIGFVLGWVGHLRRARVLFLFKLSLVLLVSHLLHQFALQLLFVCVGVKAHLGAAKGGRSWVGSAVYLTDLLAVLFGVILPLLAFRFLHLMPRLSCDLKLFNFASQILIQLQSTWWGRDSTIILFELLDEMNRAESACDTSLADIGIYWAPKTTFYFGWRVAQVSIGHSSAPDILDILKAQILHQNETAFGHATPLAQLFIVVKVHLSLLLILKGHNLVLHAMLSQFKLAQAFFHLLLGLVTPLDLLVERYLSTPTHLSSQGLQRRPVIHAWQHRFVHTVSHHARILTTS